MKDLKLSNKELEVMQTLWNSKVSLAATDITKIELKLNINTVQSVLKNLLKKSYIEVADIVYHNTVLTRTYKPILTYNDYLLNQMKAISLIPFDFVTNFVQSENDTESLQKLEDLIRKRRLKIEKGE